MDVKWIRSTVSAEKLDILRNQWLAVLIIERKFKALVDLEKLIKFCKHILNFTSLSFYREIG